MSNEEPLTTDRAQDIAQELIDYNTQIDQEFNGKAREALEQAEFLYETYGPFSLEFKDYVIGYPPLWYDHDE
jgi:hypothetical protein